VPERNADVGADRAQVEPVHLGAIEWLSDRRGPKPEPVGRSDERDVHELWRQRPQADRRLERRYPSSGDHDP
jgi:hypothetical protein